MQKIYFLLLLLLAAYSAFCQSVAGNSYKVQNPESWDKWVYGTPFYYLCFDADSFLLFTHYAEFRKTLLSWGSYRQKGKEIFLKCDYKDLGELLVKEEHKATIPKDSTHFYGYFDVWNHREWTDFYVKHKKEWVEQEWVEYERMAFRKDSIAPHPIKAFKVVAIVNDSIKWEYRIKHPKKTNYITFYPFLPILQRYLALQADRISINNQGLIIADNFKYPNPCYYVRAHPGCPQNYKHCHYPQLIFEKMDTLPDNFAHHLEAAKQTKMYIQSVVRLPNDK